MQQPIVKRNTGGHPDPQPLHTPTYLEKDQHTVVQGSTAPMQGPAVRALYTFGLAFVLAFTAVVAYYGYRVSTDFALIAALLTFGALSYAVWRMTVIVASGNYAARMEIRQRNKLELRKMKQAEAVYERQLANQAHRDRYMYELEQARMQQDKELQSLRMDLATARHGERVARNAGRHAVIDGELADDGGIDDASAGSATTNTRKGYITGDVSPVRQALMEYLFGGEEDGIYGWDGQINPNFVDLHTGKLINHTIPWSTRGPLKAAEARREAQALLQPPTQEPLVYYSQTDKSWYLNLDYADAETAQIIIGSY